MKRIIFFVILGMALYSLISIAIIEARAETVEVEPGLYIDVPETTEVEDPLETTEAEEVPDPETTEAEEVPDPETTEAEEVPDPETTEAEDLPETTEAQPDERLDYLKDLHDDNLKIMVSIWCLSGLFLGSKLISRMFGNG